MWLILAVIVVVLLLAARPRRPATADLGWFLPSLRMLLAVMLVVFGGMLIVQLT